MTMERSEDMGKTAAVITGASSGLGRAYVDEVIKAFPELDEIWLIARWTERLEEIARQYPQKHFVILGLDLSKADSYAELERTLNEHNPDIKAVVSISGVGYARNFRDGALSDQMNIIDVNVKGALAVTRLCLPYMDRGSVLTQPRLDRQSKHTENREKGVCLRNGKSIR